VHGLERRVSFVTDAAQLRECSFVVEAVAEDYVIKATVLRDLASRLEHRTVIATTTSSLSIARLAHATGDPERFAGLHVFSPVPRMDLVELAFPVEADADTRRRVRALCDVLGKTAVEVPDVPGFVVNRLLFPYLFAAVELLEATGMEAADLDRCMTLGAGHPVGPLHLLDLVGLDVASAIAREIGEALPRRVEQLIETGSLGRKSGSGFYAYPRG